MYVQPCRWSCRIRAGYLELWHPPHVQVPCIMNSACWFPRTVGQNWTAGGTLMRRADRDFNRASTAGSAWPHFLLLSHTSLKSDKHVPVSAMQLYSLGATFVLASMRLKLQRRGSGNSRKSQLQALPDESTPNHRDKTWSIEEILAEVGMI